MAMYPRLTAKVPRESSGPAAAPESKARAPEPAAAPESKARAPGSKALAPEPRVPEAPTALSWRDAAAEDRLFRSGHGGRLYRLRELAPFARLGHGLPALRAPPLGAVFGERLDRAAPALRGFPLRAHGFVVAGGAACACLMWAEPALARAFSDLDLFLVDRTDAQARDSIKALATHLAKAWPRMHVSRTVNCITFNDCSGDTGPVVQVILRLFATPLDVIGDFDLGSCAVLWDGLAVGFTAVGRFAAERGANVVNLAAHRLTYEARLARYFRRGFDIVLPDLNVSVFLLAEGRLPFLEVDLGDADQCPCHFRPSSVVPRQAGAPPTRPPPSGGWDAYNEERRIAYVSSERQVLLTNIEALARGSHRGLHARELYTPHLDMFAIEPRVDPSALRDLLRDSSYRLISTRLLKKLLGLDLASKLVVADLVHSDDYKARCAAEDEICRARAESLGAGARIRFAFLTPSSADPGAQTVTPEQWYGLAPLAGEERSS